MSSLLKLAMKIALDLVINPTRTDEALALFTEWMSRRTTQDLRTEVTQAKSESADSKVLEAAVGEVISEARVNLSPDEQERLELTVATGIASFSIRSEDQDQASETFVKMLLPGKQKTFVVWLDSASIGGGSGRYCHFNWVGEGYRVRDYLESRILHPAGQTIADLELEPVALEMTALQLWQASRAPIQCLKRYGLDFGVGETERWVKVLTLLTEAAQQWGAPGPAQ